jgi:hypothetical protein
MSLIIGDVREGIPFGARRMRGSGPVLPVLRSADEPSAAGAGGGSVAGRLFRGPSRTAQTTARGVATASDRDATATRYAAPTSRRIAAAKRSMSSSVVSNEHIQRTSRRAGSQS